MIKFAFIFILSTVYLLADAHIFVYHRFNDNRHLSTSTSTKELKANFEYFKQNNYKVIKLSQLVKKLQNKEEITDNLVVLTIDDGYKSFYENGLEIFKEYNYPFTMFIYVKASDQKYKDFLSFDELKEVAKYGELGFHSYAHPHLTKLSEEKLKLDFEIGIEKFEKNLNLKKEDVCFTYPYGEYDDLVLKVAKSYNFSCIINQNLGAVSKNADIYNLNRIALTGKVNLKQLLKYKHLNSSFISPTKYPKNSILKNIQINLEDKNIKKAQIYVSGFGWEEVKVKNAKINYNFNKKLNKNVVRVIVKANNHINTQIIIKD